MEITFSDIISVELTRRLTEYQTLLANTPGESLEEKRKELNHRYLCLQWVYFKESGGKRPATNKEADEIIEEVRRWRREIQRNCTVETMLSDGRKVQFIDAWLESNLQKSPQGIQLTIE